MTAIELLLQGIRLRHDGQLLPALAVFEQAMAEQPQFFPALLQQAAVLQVLQRYEEAVACYEATLRLSPYLAEAREGMQQALLAAIAHEQGLLKASPGDTGALFRLGNALLAQENHDVAVTIFDRLLAVQPQLVGAHINRGNTLLALNRLDEAVVSYRLALALLPDTAAEKAQIHVNLGNVLQKDLQFDAALASYDAALVLQPGLGEARMEQAHCYLMQSDFARGWPLFEWRWQTAQLSGRGLQTAAPCWDGRADLSGKTLLLWAEQGLGDSLQFVRYVPLLAERLAGMECHILLQVPAALLPLLQQSLPQGISLFSREGIAVTAAAGLPGHDYHCPLMSLPLRLSQLSPLCQATAATAWAIPAQVPYLVADPVRVAAWQQRLADAGDFPKVGLVWAGRQSPPINHTRDIALAALLPLFDADITLIGLQQEIPQGDRALFEQLPDTLHWGETLTDYADTAALISALDRVITVDTSVAHLAGALGRPVWLLLRKSSEWRWQAEGEHSAWYPTARLLRQAQHGDWASVVTQVVEQMQAALTD